MLQRLFSCVLLVFGVGYWAMQPYAAEVPIEEGFRHLAAQWEQTLKQAEMQLADKSLTSAATAQIGETVNKVRTAADDHARYAQRRVDQFEALIDALGPPPPQSETPEPEDIQKKREQLSAAKADLAGQEKQSALTVTRANTILAQITAVQFERRKSDLLNKGPLPLRSSTWIDAGKQIVTVMQAIHAREVQASGRDNLVMLPLVFLGTVLAIRVGRAVRSRIHRRWGRDPTLPYPSYSRRLLAAVVEAISQGLIPVLIIAIGLSTVWWVFIRRLLDTSIGAPTWLLYAIIFYFIAAALIRAAFSPDQPNWRLAPVTAAASEKIGRRLNLLAAVFAIQIAVDAFLQRFGEPQELAALHSSAINLLLATLLLSMLPPRLWKAEENLDWYVGQQHSALPPLSAYLRYGLAAIAIISVAANIYGYHTLANYLLRTTIFSLLLAGATYAFRFLARETSARFLTANSRRAAALQQRLRLSERGTQRLSFWLITAVDAAAIGAAVIIALALWGIPPREVWNWLARMFGSINIGTHRFSLSDLLLSLFIFSAIIVITRIVQNFMDRRLLPHTTFDVGVRTALTSGFGYVGVAIALLAGISSLGINLTGLAVVAGALSVGIGFGLQNIVNNFISGIILLVERPVKVGDIVQVDTHEGEIKKIRVRSTEMVTGNRASVIIPNSHLLDSRVVNLTYLDRSVRIEVAVNVGYDSDPDFVEEILLRCATEEKRVLSKPEPQVFLTKFGNTALEFELHAYLDDLDQRSEVCSNLRKAILRELRQANIALPTAPDAHAASQRSMAELSVRQFAEKPAPRAIDSQSPPAKT